jgi:hypothetical protein
MQASAMQALQAHGQMLFTLEETASIFRVNPQHIRDWVRDGLIVPAVKGKRAYHRPHQFTAQQIWAIANGLHLQESPRGCSRAYFAQVVREYSNKWSLSALGDLLEIHRDAWSAEERARAEGPKKPDREFPPPGTPEADDMVRFIARVMRLRMAMRTKLGLVDRTSQTDTSNRGIQERG